MSISNTTRKAGPYAYNSAGQVFAFSFKIFEQSDVEVVRTDTNGTETVLVLNTDYTVSANLATQDVTPGGNVTVNAAPGGANYKITLLGVTPSTQGVTFGIFGEASGLTAIEQGLDRVTAVAQQLEEKAARSVLVPVSSTTTPDQLVQQINADAANAAADAASAAVSASSAANSASNAAANANYYGVDSGTANTYAIAPSPAMASYVAGQEVAVKITNTNTGACTLNVSGLGAKNIKTVTGADPAAGAILAGAVHLFRYNGVNFVLLNSADSSNYRVIMDLIQAANWSERANPKALILYGVCWSGTQFVAVGAADTDAYIVTSPDGTIWTERAPTIAKAFYLFSVCWSGTQFVAVGLTDTDAYILTSPDGITWSERANPKALSLRSVCWSGTQYVAVGDADTDAYIVTSPDGITWTERAPTVAKALTLYGVCWSGTQYVAVGAADTDAYILTSPDGVTWTERAPTVAKALLLDGICWSGTQYVAVGAADTDAYILTSPDGVTWIERVNPKAKGLTSVCWSGTQYVAVGDADTDAYILSSTLRSA